MFDALVNALRTPDIRRRIIFVGIILIVYRALGHVPIPGVDKAALGTFLDSQPFLQIINLFSGGGLSSLSIVALAMTPYINASIIMQLMTGVVPRLQQLSREGEYGRNKINQYTRYLTVPLAFLQSYGTLALLANASTPVISNFDLANGETLIQMFTLAAGAVLVMWLGELITERGIGNGISFIIFAGIVAKLPEGLGQFLAAPDLAQGILFGLFAIIGVTVIVYIQEGQRRIPIQYASRVRGRRMYTGGATFLPLRVNQAGVIPIIFAISILTFPAQIASYFSNSGGLVGNVANGIVGLLDRGVHLLLHRVHVQAR